MQAVTTATAVRDAEYDEISVVDRPANQHGRIVIAKRASQEDAVADEDEDMIFDEEGYELDPDALSIGDVVFDADGDAYRVTDEDDDDDEEYAEQGELVGVGKGAHSLPEAIDATKSGYRYAGKHVRGKVTPKHRAERVGLSAPGKIGRARDRAVDARRTSSAAVGHALNSGPNATRNRAIGGGALAAGGAGGGYEYEQHRVGKALAADVQAELSKAITEADQIEVLSKAFSEVEYRAEQAEARIQASEAIAKSERDLRLSREYIAKAAEYNVPVNPERLGPVLMRMAESMSYEDCAVIHKALTSSGELLTEIGKSGGGDNADPFGQIDELLGGEVSKAFGERSKIDKAHQLTSFFDSNPEAYDEYRAARAGR